MDRIQSIAPEQAQGELKEIYSIAKQKLHMIPNMFQKMGNSPDALKLYLAFEEACSRFSISPKVRQQVALIVGQTNDCEYCLSAHSLIGSAVGLSQEEILEARRGHAKDPKVEAILQFAHKVVETRGHIADADVEQLKKAGINDTQVVELIFLINVNMLTNYFNHITDPKIDFPVAPALTASTGGNK